MGVIAQRSLDEESGEKTSKTSDTCRCGEGFQVAESARVLTAKNESDVFRLDRGAPDSESSSNRAAHAAMPQEECLPDPVAPRPTHVRQNALQRSELTDPESACHSPWIEYRLRLPAAHKQPMTAFRITAAAVNEPSQPTARAAERVSQPFTTWLFHGLRASTRSVPASTQRVIRRVSMALSPQMPRSICGCVPLTVVRQKCSPSW
jgi:hypothetical protein